MEIRQVLTMSGRVIVVLATTVGVALVGASGATAAPAATSNDLSEHCVVVVGKAPTPDAVSPVLYESCSQVSDSSRSAAQPPVVGGRLASARLMTWYEHDQLRGKSTDVYGYDGTCDSAGYRLQPNDYWSKNLSSAEGSGHCTAARFTDRAKKNALVFYLPAYNIYSFNDNVGLIQVYSG